MQASLDRPYGLPAPLNLLFPEPGMQNHSPVANAMLLATMGQEVLRHCVFWEGRLQATLGN